MRHGLKKQFSLDITKIRYKNKKTSNFIFYFSKGRIPSKGRIFILKAQYSQKI